MTVKAGEFKVILERQLYLEDELSSNYNGLQSEFEKESAAVASKHRECFTLY